MRYAVPGLASPDPLARRLPAVYAGDGMAQRLLAAYDDVLAPVHATLDNLWTYFDPKLTPPDFLDWLGGWVAASLAADRPVEQRRSAVIRAIRLHRGRGTAAGLAEEIFTEFGVWPEVVESGATTWSPVPGGAPAGDASPWLTVRVRVADPATVPLTRLRTVVENARPAHVPVTVEVLPPAEPGTTEGPGPAVEPGRPR